MTAWNDDAWAESNAYDEAALGADDEVQDDGPTTYYRSVDEFVREYLRHVYGCKIDGRTRVWAAEWWRYIGAVTRLEALWRAWEHLRLDGATGISVWLRDHADHHMNVLFDPAGPFEAADPLDEANHAMKGGPLPYAAPPAGLY